MSKQAITTWHGKFSVSSKWKTLTKQKGNMPNIIYKIINSGPAQNSKSNLLRMRWWYYYSNNYYHINYSSYSLSNALTLSQTVLYCYIYISKQPSHNIIKLLFRKYRWFVQTTHLLRYNTVYDSKTVRSFTHYTLATSQAQW